MRFFAGAVAHPCHHLAKGLKSFISALATWFPHSSHFTTNQSKLQGLYSSVADFAFANFTSIQSFLHSTSTGRRRHCELLQRSELRRAILSNRAFISGRSPFQLRSSHRHSFVQYPPHLL
jgi:hypothetical protein